MIFYIYHKKEMETLKLNSTGPLVELVQHVLKNLGLFYSNIDGIYGMQTQRAVMRFQTDWGLSTDGIVGQNTWAAFMPYINGYTVHPIRVGDTFFTLAQQYGTTISSIIFANPNSNPNNLYIGQKIIVPFGKIVPTNISYSSEILNLNLNALSRVYPFLEISNMGKSVLGKNIPVIKIGNGSKQVFYSAAIHANEWITSPLLMDFLENLCEAYVNNFRMRGLNIRNILENTTLFIAPMVNPYTIETPRIQLAYPQYSWELETSDLLEGPAMLFNPDRTKLFCVYSCCQSTTKAYKLGMLELDLTDPSTSDPLIPANWKKSMNPVFTVPVSGVFVLKICSFALKKKRVCWVLKR